MEHCPLDLFYREFPTAARARGGHVAFAYDRRFEMRVSELRPRNRPQALVRRLACSSRVRLPPISTCIWVRYRELRYPLTES